MVGLWLGVLRAEEFRNGTWPLVKHPDLRSWVGGGRQGRNISTLARAHSHARGGGADPTLDPNDHRERTRRKRDCPRPVPTRPATARRSSPQPWRSAARVA